MLSAYDWGLKYESCALEARKQFDIDYPGLGQPGWYEYCDRGDYLLWQLSKLPGNKFKELIPALVRAIDKIADRAVKTHALNCGVIKIEQWAKNWLDRYRSSAKAAMATAIGTKAELAVKAAIEAIEAAAAAAEISAEAAAEISADYLKELKLQAIDIRSEIPQWPQEVE